MASRGGARWEPSEDAQLKREHATGVSFERMVVNHSRTESAIRARLAHVQPWHKPTVTGPRASVHLRRGSRWSAEEEEFLVRLHGDGVALAQMAAAHGRTEGAIIARLCQVQPWTKEASSDRIDHIVDAERSLRDTRGRGLASVDSSEITEMMVAVSAASDVQWQHAERRMAKEDSSDEELESILAHLRIADSRRQAWGPTKAGPDPKDQTVLRQLASKLDGRAPSWEELCDTGVKLRDGNLLNTASLMSGAADADSCLSLERVAASIRAHRERVARRAVKSAAPPPPAPLLHQAVKPAAPPPPARLPHKAVKVASSSLPALPQGWERVPSRSRPGEWRYLNKITGQRVVRRPTTPATAAAHRGTAAA